MVRSALKRERATTHAVTLRKEIVRIEPKLDRNYNSMESQMLRENDHWIRQIARRMAWRCPRHLNLADEFVQIGREAFLNALTRYNPRKSAVRAFTENRVIGAILDEMRKMDPLGRDTRQKIRKLHAGVSNYINKKGRPPSEQELAQSTKLKVQEIRDLRVSAAMAQSRSLDELKDRDVSFPSEENAKNPLDNTIEIERKQIASSLIDRLNRREKRVIKFHYFEGLTLKEVGKKLGVSESRVCQIITVAIKKMREAFIEEEEDAADKYIEARSALAR